MKSHQPDMILKADCRHFPGDRPCHFHKQEGVVCPDCSHYETISFRILIVKLDAVGDVLRTTSILHGFKERYPASEITWVTRVSALPLFEQNHFVDHVIPYESTDAVVSLGVQEFDLLVNLDTSLPSSSLASFVRAKDKVGFGLDTRGNVYPFNKEANAWFQMGAFDHIKKQNSRTYQDLMLDICRLTSSTKEIILRLSEDEARFAENFARQMKISQDTKCIGMNTGAGSRWQFKQWTLEGYQSLIKMILRETDHLILLYGGSDERERNALLSAIDPVRVINTGTENSLRQFFALLTLCDVLLTGDTLAMHAATALGKRVVALFGPTSEAEIETYGGRIVKVHADLDCLCCYKMRCDFDPNCMNSISAERLLSILKLVISQPLLSSSSK